LPPAGAWRTSWQKASDTYAHCGKAIEAWSDGNPYYIDVRGRKQYAYRPDHKRLAKCIGNDSPHLCLVCGGEFVVDLRAPVAACPKCGATEIAKSFHLGGQRCPYCKAGVFAADPDIHCIS
jgi:DNA-directed RNA polymerase subunit RPC12/RpoP